MRMCMTVGMLVVVEQLAEGQLLGVPVDVYPATSCVVVGELERPG
jgi:hypothetical protein